MAAVLNHSMLDAAVTRAFVELIQPGSMVVDGGAHVGYYSLLAAGLVGHSGIVYAFEPHPTLAGLLRRNVSLNGADDRVRVAELALAETSGDLALWTSERVSTNGSILGSDGDQKSIPIRSVDLDSFLDSAQAPTGIKLDLEGGEAEAILGMRRTLKRIDWLISEVNAPRLRQSGHEPAEFLRSLQELGEFQTLSLLVNDSGRPLEATVGNLERELTRHGYANVLLQRDHSAPAPPPQRYDPGD